jgi:hypothetical protein
VIHHRHEGQGPGRGYLTVIAEEEARQNDSVRFLLKGDELHKRVSQPDSLLLHHTHLNMRIMRIHDAHTGRGKGPY